MTEDQVNDIINRQVQVVEEEASNIINRAMIELHPYLAMPVAEGKLTGVATLKPYWREELAKELRGLYLDDDE